MQRRTFLLGLFGVVTGAAGLIAAPAQAISPSPLPEPPQGPEPDAAVLGEEDIAGLEISEARRRRRRRRRWWRRRGWGRRYRRRRWWGRRVRGRRYRIRGSGRGGAAAPRRRSGWRTPGEIR